MSLLFNFIQDSEGTELIRIIKGVRQYIQWKQSLISNIYLPHIVKFYEDSRLKNSKTNDWYNFLTNS